MPSEFQAMTCLGLAPTAASNSLMAWSSWPEFLSAMPDLKWASDAESAWAAVAMGPTSSTAARATERTFRKVMLMPRRLSGERGAPRLLPRPAGRNSIRRRGGPEDAARQPEQSVDD